MDFMSGRAGFNEDGTGNTSSIRGARPPNYAYTAAAPPPTDNRHLPMLYSAGAVALIEREHMFDKVVTPSDVGKLNRLVIPKQYAEKYFPMDSSANEKGLLLNFEDKNGKPWRFRYSYWNSSQSYVMTKGWSRFVKEKKLDAGDVVSFYRGVGESGKDRLFIDWRRRPDVPQLPPPIPVFSSIPSQFSVGHPYWNPLFLTHHRRYSPTAGYSPFYEKGSGINEMVYSSVPVVQGKAVVTAKRLRLFGVNMDCPITVSDKCDRLQASSTTTMPSPPPCLSLSSSSSHASNYNHKGKAASISLDLDISHL